MKFSEMMIVINKAIANGLNEISKSDVEFLFGRADNRLAEELRYLGCEVVKVHDIFNVKLGERFTKKEIQSQRDIENMFKY